MHLPNLLHPNRLSAAERHQEVCRLLAAGVLRLNHRQSDERSGALPESSLPFPPDRSGHANPTKRRTA